MKNEYVAPELKLVMIQAENILQTSAGKDPMVTDPWDDLELNP